MKDQQSKHTPTPWKINPVETYHLDIVGNERPLYPNKKGGLQCDRICSMDDNFERRPETQANAAFIVKACNSYETMKDALQKIASAWQNGNTKGLGEIAEKALKASEPTPPVS